MNWPLGDLTPFQLLLVLKTFWGILEGTEKVESYMHLLGLYLHDMYQGCTLETWNAKNSNRVVAK